MMGLREWLTDRRAPDRLLERRCSGRVPPIGEPARLPLLSRVERLICFWIFVHHLTHGAVERSMWIECEVSSGHDTTITDAVDQSLPCHEPATWLCLSDLQVWLLLGLPSHWPLPSPARSQLSQHCSRAWAIRQLTVENAIRRRICSYRHGFSYTRYHDG